MIIGVHALLYSKDAAADRAFLMDVLGLPGVDVDHGWLIMKLPPAEIAVHPTDDGDSPWTELYLMCDDVKKTVAELESKGVRCSEIQAAGWGMRTQITLPSGATLGMYQPRHALAINL